MLQEENSNNVCTPICTEGFSCILSNVTQSKLPSGEVEVSPGLRLDPPLLHPSLPLNPQVLQGSYHVMALAAHLPVPQPPALCPWQAATHLPNDQG